MENEIIKKFDLFNSKYDCKVCRKKLRYKADEIIHLKLKHANNGSTIQCPTCNRKYRTYYALKLHLMKAHLNERPYGCKLCKNKFSAFVKLKRHCHKCHPTLPLYEIIDYDNSKLEITNGSDNVRYVSFLNRFKFVETIYKSDDENVKKKRPMNLSTSSSCICVTNKISVECGQCTIEFGTSAELLCHIWLKHMGATRLFCWNCSVEFYNQLDLVNHLNERHLNSELGYKCQICNRSFLSLDSVKQHIQLIHSNSKFAFSCATCKHSFNSEKLLFDHFHRSDCREQKNTIKCQECPGFRFSEDSYKLHELQHSYKSNNINWKPKFNNYSVDSLISTSTTTTTTSTTTTSNSFNNASCARTNRIDHIASKLIQQKQQQQQQSINHHLQPPIENPLLANSAFLVPPTSRAHQLPTSQFNFDFESFRASYEASLRKFLASPKLPNLSNLIKNEPQVFLHSHQLFKCEYCGYTFKSVFEMEQHKLVHTSANPKRPFKCHLCMVTFAKTDQLLKHMVVHKATEFDSVCQFCFSSFSRKQDLDRHMQFHYK